VTSPQPPRAWSVRFTPHATDEALEAAARWAELNAPETSGEERQQRALAWYAGMEAAAGTLATNPRRFAVRERESRLLGLQVHALLHRHTAGGGGGGAYHAFYQVEDDTPDVPRVTILHVRHAARRPLTRAEAREIQTGPNEP